jgi:hypothetical protein
MWALAEQELRGVGDASLGEWREGGAVAVHLRRRLTPQEMKRGAIAGVVDVRGTIEHVARVERVRPFLPAPLRTLPVEMFP